MPITLSKAVADPCAPLSWNTTVVILALEKLRRGKVLKEDETNAIENVAEQLKLLSEASQIHFDEFDDESEVLPTYLRSSFFTLVAIESGRSAASSPPDFGEAGQELLSVAKKLTSGEPVTFDASTLKRVKAVCVELLEHLNDQRPNSSFR